MARAPALSTLWVCSSVPVTMLARDHRAGVWEVHKSKSVTWSSHNDGNNNDDGFSQVSFGC